MNRRDFIDSLVIDSLAFIEENNLHHLDEDDLYELLVVSPVTGCADGYYYKNSYPFEQPKCLDDRINWETLELFFEACAEYSYDVRDISRQFELGPENVEIVIRDFLLGEALSEVMERLAEQYDE